MIEKLKEMIRRHEGLRLAPYPCPTSHRSIGYGWNMDANKLPHEIESHLRINGAITKPMAERLLSISIDTTMMQCRDLWKDYDNYSENRRLALFDLVYNMGAGKVVKAFPKFYTAVLKGDWETAADELMYKDGKTKAQTTLYYTQVGNRGKEIVELLRRG